MRKILLATAAVALLVAGTSMTASAKGKPNCAKMADSEKAACMEKMQKGAAGKEHAAMMQGEGAKAKGKGKAKGAHDKMMKDAKEKTE